jgi:hypothetical protein
MRSASQRDPIMAEVASEVDRAVLELGGWLATANRLGTTTGHLRRWRAGSKADLVRLRDALARLGPAPPLPR